jgi:hypothetical protein
MKKDIADVLNPVVGIFLAFCHSPWIESHELVILVLFPGKTRFVFCIREL